MGGDQRTDLALLEFTSSDSIPVIDLGNSDDARTGQWVLAVGNPFGFESTVTVGIISARRADRSARVRPFGGFTEYIQTDAAVNPRELRRRARRPGRTARRREHLDRLAVRG